MEYLKAKRIPYYYLYDKRGSELFDEVTKLEEYYPFRKESELLNQYAEEILTIEDDTSRAKITLVEFGAGYSDKTKILLGTLLNIYSKVTFIPIDISESACEVSRIKYSELNNLEVKPFVGKYEDFFDAKVNHDSPVVYIFLGNTIGNLERDDQVQFMRRINDCMNPRDILVIGFDTCYKDHNVIRRAYDDEKRATEAFMLNILSHLNTKYNLNCKVEHFSYDVKWNPFEKRIEMGLICEMTTTVVDNLTSLEIQKGERIHIENSHKFDLEKVEHLARESNLSLKKHWLNDDKYYMSCQFVKNI